MRDGGARGDPGREWRLRMDRLGGGVSGVPGGARRQVSRGGLGRTPLRPPGLRGGLRDPGPDASPAPLVAGEPSRCR